MKFILKTAYESFKVNVFFCRITAMMATTGARKVEAPVNVGAVLYLTVSLKLFTYRGTCKMCTDACKNCTSSLWHEKDIFILTSKESSKKAPKNNQKRRLVKAKDQRTIITIVTGPYKDVHH